MKSRYMLLVVLGVVGVAASGPLVKWSLMNGASPVSIAFLRMLVSACCLLPVAIHKGELKQILRGTKGQLALLTLAALCLALHYILWMTSLERTSTFASVALVCTQPLFVAALSGVLLGERIQKRAIPGAVIALAGALTIGLFSISSHGGDVMGDLLALAGAVVMAGHWLCGRAARRDMPAIGYMTCIYVLTTGILGLAMPFLGGFQAPPAAIPGAVLLALICTLGGHAVFTYAIGYVSADVISFALLGEPIGAALLSLFFFGEQVSLPLMAGGGLILAGLTLYLRGSATGEC